MSRIHTKMDSAALTSAMGVRQAAFLRAEFPRDTAKRICAEFEVKLETATGWLAGRLAQNRYLAAMSQRFGARFHAFVWAPCGDWTRVLELEAEAQALAGRLDALNAAWASYRELKAAHP